MAQQTAEFPTRQTIAQQFGSSPDYYHRNAELQREVSERLINSLKPWRDILPDGPILELGCGTGFLTEQLADLYPERELIVSDLSPGMLDFCRTRLGERKGIRYLQMDAEDLEERPRELAMSISSFTAQWFRDPALALGRWLEVTRPGGLMLASMPGNDSFPEWRRQCERLGLPFTGNPLPDTEEMVIKLSAGPAQVDYFEDTVTRRFPSATDFFRHLKRIGAGTRVGGRSLGAKEMKLLIREWDRESGGPVSVSYHLLFLAVKRDL